MFGIGGWTKIIGGMPTSYIFSIFQRHPEKEKFELNLSEGDDSILSMKIY